MKKLLLPILLLFASLLLVSCKGKELTHEELVELFSNITIVEDGILETSFSLNTTSKNEIVDLNGKLITDFTQVYLDATIKMDDPVEKTSETIKATVYLPGEEYGYVNLTLPSLPGFDFGTGKFRFDTSDIIDSVIPEFPMIPEIPVGPGMDDSLMEFLNNPAIIKFMSEFTGFKATKSGNKVTVELNINKKILNDNAQIIVDMINAMAGFDVATKHMVDELVLEFGDTSFGLKLVVQDTKLSSISANFKIDNMDGMEANISGSVTVKYVSAMPEFPSFTDYVDFPTEFVQ